MIVSASYKTDLPAFYGDWFMTRLQAGYCMMRNPMNRKPIRVPLDRGNVDGIVFWTKNFRPFMKHVPRLESCGFPFYVQYTINGYPRSLETNVVDWRKSVETVWELSRSIGKRSVVWRYDTVVVSAETPLDFHVRNFSQIAQSLEGVTDEAVVSFLQLYRKTERNLAEMTRAHDNPWRDPSTSEKRDLAATLYEIARGHGIDLTICSQPDLITVQSPARCIDTKRLGDVAGRPISVKTLGNRPGCECAASRDIGDYDTCPHGCVYCYAVRSQPLAVERFRRHDPMGEYLFSDPSDPIEAPRTSLAQGSLDFGME